MISIRSNLETPDRPASPNGQLVADLAGGHRPGEPGLDATVPFTDKTLVYLTYSRGYKGGGFNTPCQASFGGAAFGHLRLFADLPTGIHQRLRDRDQELPAPRHSDAERRRLLL